MKKLKFLTALEDSEDGMQVKREKVLEPSQKIEVLVGGTETAALELSESLEETEVPFRCGDDELNDTERTILGSDSSWLDTKIVDMFAEDLFKMADPKKFFLLSSQALYSGLKLRRLTKFVTSDCKDGYKYILMPMHSEAHFVLCIMVCVRGEISEALYLDPLDHCSRNVLELTKGYVEEVATAAQKSHGKDKDLEFCSTPRLVHLKVCAPRLFVYNQFSINSFEIESCRILLMKIENLRRLQHRKMDMTVAFTFLLTSTNLFPT